MFEYMSSEMLRQNVVPACVEVKKCGNTFLTNVFHRNMCGAPPVNHQRTLPASSSLCETSFKCFPNVRLVFALKLDSLWFDIQ